MKARDSGMPEETLWRTFFDPDQALTALGLPEKSNHIRDVVDFGCGYGTFSIPAAKRIQGALYGLDIEASMIAHCQRLAAKKGIHNTRFIQRDFVAQGAGLKAASMDYAMVFNLLHMDEPVTLLREAWRILTPGGQLAVMHWNHDPTTPRGPSLDIRPRPEDCARWIREAGFLLERSNIHLPPYHYGVLGQKRGD